MATKFLRRFCSQAKKVAGEAVKEVSEAKEAKSAEGGKEKKKDKDKETKDKNAKKPPYKNKHISFESTECKRINVSLQGANTRAGFATALLLKQHPLIKKIYMYDTKLNTKVAGDLNAIDSSAKVEAFCGDALPYSLRAADIAVLIDTDIKDCRVHKKYELSYFRVKRFAETCTLHCPKAVIIVNVEPICCMTSLVQCILEETPFYHPSRLLGNVSGLQSMINTVAARNLNLDPTSVHVPLIGGPDIETIVPVISLMTPDPGLSPRDQVTFYQLIKKEVSRVVYDFTPIKSTMHDGYAIGKICLTVAKGLNGHDDALGSVLSRSSKADPLKYLVSTVRFGPGGIYHNYGIPKLTKFELHELERSILTMEKREQKIRDIQLGITKSYLTCYPKKSY